MQKNDMKITVCNHCELIFIKGHWTNFFLIDVGSPSLITKITSLIIQDWNFYYKPKKMDIHEIKFEYDENGYTSAITGTVDIFTSPDVFVPLLSISEDFKIDINWGECSECRTRLTGSYSSKIQIRSPKKIETSELKQWALEIEELSKNFPLTDGKNPLFKIIYLKNGIDALFQTKTSANSIGRLFSKDHGGIVSVTTEFAGFDKSKWKEYPRKQVVLISLPEFAPDEIVILNNNPIQIYQFKSSKVEYWDFAKKIKEKMSIKSFIEARPRKIGEGSQQFQIVNFEPEEEIAQIMNVNSYETFYVDSDDVLGFKEGEVFWGTVYDGKILIKQKFP
jgi:NMD protein affecting ribosome stability and mRNA decay